MHRQKQGQQEDLRSQTSNSFQRSEVKEFPPMRTSAANHRKMPASILCQHENILRVSHNRFRGAERVGPRWCEPAGKSLA